MKVKINNNKMFWIQMLIDKFGLTKEEATNKINKSENSNK